MDQRFLGVDLDYIAAGYACHLECGESDMDTLCLRRLIPQPEQKSAPIFGPFDGKESNRTVVDFQQPIDGAQAAGTLVSSKNR